MLRDLDDLAGILLGDIKLLRDLLDRRLTSILLNELLCRVANLAHRLNHMYRDPDGTRLVGNRTSDRLANPPGRVGGELITPPVLVFLNRLHEARVPFLDQVEEGESPVSIALGDTHHEPQVAA